MIILLLLASCFLASVLGLYFVIQELNSLQLYVTETLLNVAAELVGDDIPRILQSVERQQQSLPLDSAGAVLALCTYDRPALPEGRNNLSGISLNLWNS